MMQNNQAIPFNKENFKQIFSIKFISVIIISIPSALIAEYFNLPLAWFLGPMLITSLASLMGLKTKMPRLVLSSILIILGLYIGNYIDKDLFLSNARLDLDLFYNVNLHNFKCFNCFKIFTKIF